VPVLGVTGGVATGKSSFTGLLLRHLPAERFDADQTAHELLNSEAAVRRAVVETFGDVICDAEGNPDRTKLRALVFDDESKRRQLERILHPAIRMRWTARAAEIAREGGWFVVDIPLLFETQAEASFDRIVVVACSPATQRRRLTEQRGLTADLAEKIITSQLDLATKINQAHHVIWNDSSLPWLERQARLLAAALTRSCG
jgi:dephospho-CoA kinase